MEGLEDAERSLIRLAGLASDFRPFWGKATSLFISWMRRQFETEGEFAGEKWVELSPGYLAWKLRHYPGKPILQAKGDLRKAASRPERIQTPTSLTLRIIDPKVSWHQEGAGNNPERPILFDDLPAVAEAELHQAVGEYADDILRRAGFSAF